MQEREPVKGCDEEESHSCGGAVVTQRWDTPNRPVSEGQGWAGIHHPLVAANPGESAEVGRQSTKGPTGPSSERGVCFWKPARNGQGPIGGQALFRVGETSSSGQGVKSAQNRVRSGRDGSSLGTGSVR